MTRHPDLRSALRPDHRFQIRRPDPSFHHAEKISHSEDAVNYDSRMGEHFGSWLKKQLFRRQMNQAEFARRASLPTSTVSNWTTGRSVPDPDACDAIAEALFLRLDDVLAAAGHRPLDDRQDADSPGARIIAMAGRVQWNPDREAAVESILRGYIERDRKRDA